MLTAPSLTGSRLRVPDLEIDPSVVRSAREIVTDDLPRLVRRADVPRRFEAGMDLATGAIETAAERLPGRRRRSPWRPWAPAIAIVSVVALVGLTGWWIARRNATSTEVAIDWDREQEALERATSEGMAEAPADPSSAATA